MLSFKSNPDSRLIARIKGGKYDGKKVYIEEFNFDHGKKNKGKKFNHHNKDNESDNDDEEIPYDIAELLDDKIFNKMKKRDRIRELMRIQNMLDDKTEPLRKDDMFYKIRKKRDKNKMKELIIHDGEVRILPQRNTRECLYVSAPSGGGKSTFLSNYTKEFKKIFPKRRVILFSKIKKDDILDKLNPKRIPLDDNELVTDPIMPEELENSLVIFDDIDTLRNKKIKSAMYELVDDLLETGRHDNIYVLITSHMLTNYKKTRTILNECKSITIFPYSSTKKSIEYCLKNYFGLTKHQINKIMKLPSRWVTIFRNAPYYVIYSRGIYIL